MNNPRKSRKNPCYMCEERSAGCHSKCERYIAWSAKRNEMLVALYKQRLENDAVVASNKRRVRHMPYDNKIVDSSRKSRKY